MKLNPFAMWTFSKKYAKKTIDSDKNWEIYTGLKFSLGIKVQQRLAEPLVSVRRNPRSDAARSHMS